MNDEQYIEFCHRYGIKCVTKESMKMENYLDIDKKLQQARDSIDLAIKERSKLKKDNFESMNHIARALGKLHVCFSSACDDFEGSEQIPVPYKEEDSVDNKASV